MSGDDDVLKIHDDEEDEMWDVGEMETEKRTGLRVSIESGADENSTNRRVVVRTSVDLAEEPNNLTASTFITESDVFDAAILPSDNGTRAKSYGSTAAVKYAAADGSPNGYHHAGAERFISDSISADLYEENDAMDTAQPNDIPGRNELVSYQQELVALEEQFEQITKNGRIAGIPGDEGSEGSESEDSSSDSSSESGGSESEAAEREKKSGSRTSSSISPTTTAPNRPSDQSKSARVPIVPPDPDRPAGCAKRRRSPIRSPMENPKKIRDSKGRRASPSRGKESESTEGDPRLKWFLDDARFFLIKSGNCENVILSKAKGVWATTPINEKTLNNRFRDTRNVILIFSVEKSGSFQGIARMGSEADRTRSPVNWVLPPGMNPHSLGGVFEVQWLCRNELSFDKTFHLKNPYNENKSVKIGRDGTDFRYFVQEIEPRVGKQLCNMFPADVALEIDDLLSKVKRYQRSHAVPSSSPNKGKRYSDSRRRPEPPVPERRESERYRERNGDWEMRSRPPVTGSNSAEYNGRSSYGGVSRDTIMNGNYFDYMREYSMSGAPSYMSYSGYMGGYPTGHVAAPHPFDYPPYPSSYSSGAPYSLTPPTRGSSDHHLSGRYASQPAPFPPVLPKNPKYDERMADFMDRIGSERRGDRRSDRDRKSERNMRDRPVDRPSGRENSRHHRHSRSASPHTRRNRHDSTKRPHNNNSTSAAIEAGRTSHRRKSDSRRH